MGRAVVVGGGGGDEVELLAELEQVGGLLLAVGRVEGLDAVGAEGADQVVDLARLGDVPVGVGDDGDAAGLVDQLDRLLGGRPAARHEGLGAGHQVLLEEGAEVAGRAGRPGDVGAADRERVAGLADRVLEV